MVSVNGVSPEILSALRRFDLITEEQAEEAWDDFIAEGEQFHEEAEWWKALAEVAAKQYMSSWQRFWSGTTWWKYDWVREKRG